MDRKILNFMMAILAIALIIDIELSYEQKGGKSIHASTFSNKRAFVLDCASIQSLHEIMVNAQFQQKEDEQFVSPDKKKILFIKKNRPSELWIKKVNGTGKKKIVCLEKDEGVTSVTWSPDSKLIAFVSYNLLGHSPMTTTHVCVIRPDGSGLKKVILPKPYERFSTCNPVWKTNETLIVRAMTLYEHQVKYMYTYKSGKIEVLNSK